MAQSRCWSVDFHALRRSLGRDLAQSLGTAAVMSALVRTRIGSFSLDDAIELRQLTANDWPKLLHPPLRAVDYLPRVQLSSEETTRIQNGLTIEIKGEVGRWKEDEPLAVSPSASPLPLGEGQGEGGWRENQELAAVDPAGQLVGILVSDRSERWRPLLNLPVYHYFGPQGRRSRKWQPSVATDWSDRTHPAGYV
jgi:tRNA U55 pseudouridine synthase TruB